MKNLKKIFILCAAILLISGCSMKSEYKMEISKDKSMKFSVTSAMDDELIEGLLSMQNNTNIDMSTNCINDETGMTNCGSTSEEKKEYTDEEKWSMLEESIEGDENPEDFGFTKTRYEKDEYKGFTYTINISNIDNISGETANFTFEDFKEISKKIVFVKEGNNYKANFNLSSSEETEENDIEADIKFIVTLPNEPISHNATEVSEDGKTLTWDLADKDTQNIVFEFSLINPLLIYGIIGGIALLIIVIVILIISKRKKKKNNQNMEVNQETNLSYTENNDSNMINNPYMNNFEQNTMNQNPINSYETMNNQNMVNQPYTNNFEQNNNIQQPINSFEPINNQSEINNPYMNNNIQNNFNQTPIVNFEQPTASVQNHEPEIIGEEFNEVPNNAFPNITNEQIANVYNEQPQVANITVEQQPMNSIPTIEPIPSMENNTQILENNTADTFDPFNSNPNNLNQ